MAEKVKVRVVAAYNGHNIKPNKNVDISLKCRYDELTNYIQLIQFLNEDVDIVAKVGDNPANKLGSFRVKEIKVDHDGEGVLKFNSQLDFVNADDINSLVGEELIKVQFTAEIEEEEEEDDEE